MRLFLALLLLIPFGLNAATVFTEFYCDSTVGTNVNSGSTTNAAALYTSVSGNWTNATATFLPADGLDSSTNVAVGDWVSIFVNGSTNLVQSGAGGWVAQVTNVTAGVNGKIMLSQAAFMGTKPSDLVATATLKKGGAWNGPYGSIGFPFGFLATTATNAPNVFPRCNLKNTAQYNVTAAMTHSLAGPVLFQGMTLTEGDGGKATIDGGTTGTSFVLLTLSGANNDLMDFIFANNGNSGTAAGLISANAPNSNVRGVVVHDAHRTGFSIGASSAGSYFSEIEAYNCNKANVAGQGGISIASSAVRLESCYSHDNAGTSSDGFASTAVSVTLYRCISANNTRSGFQFQGNTIHLINCDAYNNGGAGLLYQLATVGEVVIKNCNFIKNTTHGITNSSAIRAGEIINCGFGSGTMANGGVNIANAGGISEVSSLSYSADTTPWVDPSNGNFSIASGSLARAAGRSQFLQYTVNPPTNTVSFVDIGAAQSASTNAAASGGGSYTFAQ